MTKHAESPVLVFQRPVICDQLCGAEPQAADGGGGADAGEGHMGGDLQQLPDGERGPPHHY